jgi:hypothetical protein
MAYSDLDKMIRVDFRKCLTSSYTSFKGGKPVPPSKEFRGISPTHKYGLNW